MPLLILAVIFAVVQTSPPVPRQATDKQASQTAKDHRKANSSQSNTTPPIPAAQPPSTLESNGTTDAERHKNAEETIRVRELPPVTVKAGPDGWTRAYVLLTAALVIVGSFGVCYARKSLKAIESQLHKMGEQVTEMQKAGVQTGNIIDHMKKTAERELRAYVCLAEAVIEFRQERAPEIRVSMSNFGKTPAYDLRWKSGGPVISAYPWRGTFPELAEHPTTVSVLAPGGKPQTMQVRPDPPIPAELEKILGTPQATLWVFGTLTYRDAFGIPHFTNYRLMYGGAETIYPRQHPTLGFKTDGLKTDRAGNEAD